VLKKLRLQGTIEDFTTYYDTTSARNQILANNNGLEWHPFIWRRYQHGRDSQDFPFKEDLKIVYDAAKLYNASAIAFLSGTSIIDPDDPNNEQRSEEMLNDWILNEITPALDDSAAGATSPTAILKADIVTPIAGGLAGGLGGNGGGSLPGGKPTL